MNNTFKIKNIALSALLLASIAAPISANAAANPNQTDTNFVKTDGNVAVASALINLPDPLEAAKKYAPDTVADWQNILNRYNSLRPVKTLSIEGQKANVSTKNVHGETINISLEEAGSVKNIKGIKVGEAIPVSSTEKHELNGKTTAAVAQLRAADDSFSLTEAGPIGEVKDAKMGEVISVLKLEKSGVSDALVATTAKSGQAVTAAAQVKVGGFSTLIQGQIALGKAIESGDSSEIKAQLASLLKEYKTQVAELEAAAK